MSLSNIGFAVAIAIAIGVPTLLVASVFVAVRRSGDSPRFNLDLQAVYLFVVALVSLLIALFGAFGLVDTAAGFAFQTYLPPEVVSARPLPEGTAAPTTPEEERFRQDQLRGRFVREQLAEQLAIVVVTLPVWWFHWRGARQRSYQRRAFLGLRLYLYLVMVVTLVTAVVSGAQALGQLFQWLLGTVEWADSRAGQEFGKGVTTAAVNSLIALGVWMYHRRELSRVPEDVTPVAAGK